MDPDGRRLVAHWAWAGEKGLMNKNTAAALKAACAQVLRVVDGWERVDIRSLDVEDTLRRFENLRKKEFKPKTLDAYTRRFKQAVNSYLAYVEDPRGWRPHAQDRATRTQRSPKPARDAALEAEHIRPSRLADDGSLVDYPFPLRNGLTVRLALPRDLKLAEVRRLTAFISTLASDFEPSVSDA